MTAKWNTDTHKHTHRYTHTHNAKPAAEYEDVTRLWNQGVSTNREVTKKQVRFIN
jgi:hypothetical protein